MYCSAQPCLASCQSLAYLLGFVPWLGGAEPVTSQYRNPQRPHRHQIYLPLLFQQYHAKPPHSAAYDRALKRFLEPLISVINIRHIGLKAVPCTFLGGRRPSDGYLSAMPSGSEYRRPLGGFYQGV